MADHVDVAGYVLGTLAPPEAAAFETHLATCDRCRAELAELDALPGLLAGAELAPPPQLRARTLDAVRRASGPTADDPVLRLHQRGFPPASAAPLTPTPPTSQPARLQDTSPRSQPAHPQELPPRSQPARPQDTSPTSEPARPQDTSLTSEPVRSSDGVVTPFRSRRRAAARWIGAAAAALLLVAAVGVSTTLLRGGGGGGTTVALVAADVGTGRGSAVVRPVGQGREVRLTVHGLPPNPPGTYYECWFVGPGDTEQHPNRVSAGTFTVGSDGSASVRMISAADASRFPRMGVTLEPDDGNPARTGPKYLVTAP